LNHWVYIVLCSDNTLYTGYSTDVDARVKKHNSGKGAKYTKKRLPVKLVYKKEYPSKSEAMSREYQIKQLSRVDKLGLINENKQN
jgi:putative endonuclease